MPGGYILSPGASGVLLFGHKGSISTSDETTSFHLNGILRTFSLNRGATALSEAAL
jgi:hypothetical protein